MEFSFDDMAYEWNNYAYKKDKKAYWEETKARFPGIELYCTQTEIASYFGVSKSTMHRIMK